MWNQPNEEQYRKTIVDPRVNEQTNTNDDDLSKEIEDISPTQLLELKKHASKDDKETTEELLKLVVESDFSNKDVKEIAKQPSSTENPFQAIEEVKRAKEASEEARGFMLDRMRFGGQTGGAIEKAARATGKDKSVVIKDAVQYYLREEGFL